MIISIDKKRLYIQNIQMNPNNNISNNRPKERNMVVCRYGVNCKKIADGTCTFYHPENGNSHVNYQMNPRYQNSRGKGQNNRFARSQSRGHRGGTNQKPYHQNHNQHLGGNSNGNLSKSSQVCLNFHHGQECHHNPCRFKHEFIYNQPEGLQRYFYFRGIPQGFNKLSKIQTKDKIFFIIRSNSTINYFQYCPLNNNISPPTTILQITPELTKRNFYHHNDNYIYYCFQNKHTALYSMGIYNLSTSQLQLVENCHTAPITGLIHYNSSVLLSSCMDGKLKYWNIVEDKIIINQESTEFLQTKINPNKMKLSVLYIGINIIKQNIKIISIGLNNGKLGLFIVLNQQEMKYQEMQFEKDQDAHILKVRYRQSTTNGKILIYVLSWSGGRTSSSILSANLNQESSSQFKRIICSNNQRQHFYVHLEIIGKYLIVGNIKGEIMLYGLEDEIIKGIIINRHSVADIMEMTINLEETGVEMKFLGVLEENEEKEPGSIGIYKFW